MNTLGTIVDQKLSGFPAGNGTQAWQFVAKGLAVGVLVGALGCHELDRDADVVPAPDFALRFHVAGDAGSDDVLRKTSQYVLEPNRHLRVALGRGAKVNFFPRLARVISRAEFEDLSRHVFSDHLMAEPTSIGSHVDDVDVRYEVEISAHGRTHRYTTTPADSPPTVQLLARLTVLHAQRSSGVWAWGGP